MIGLCARCGAAFQSGEEDTNHPGSDLRGPECPDCFHRRERTQARAMKIVALRGAKHEEPCVEASKMRGDGKFHRWCVKHHHWLNDGPAQTTVLEHHLAELAKPTES